MPTLINGPLKEILDRVFVTYLDSYSGCFDTFMTSILPNFDRDTARGLDGLIYKDSYDPNHFSGQVLI